ncbi:CBS domain-containing protein [Allokutzneria albata]|uniref:CBS domain-containing protein n=1 Tax=Allokutzneria albata TaxID=211114 RepID=A0A1G9SPY2_ALLAB|nr:CBS domain-containing protein [Allokutzneria albata]SDM37519.1 CBS domain-containing protein [Allokutzneria albata]
MRNRTVRSVMSTDVITVTPRTLFTYAARLVVEHGISALPVVDAAGALVGVVTEVDLLVRQARRGEPGSVLDGWLHRHARRRAGMRTVGEVMTPRPETAGADLQVSTAANLVARSGCGRLFVVDERGRLAGVVTRRDLLPDAVMPDVVDELEADQDAWQGGVR